MRQTLRQKSLSPCSHRARMRALRLETLEPRWLLTEACFEGTLLSAELPEYWGPNGQEIGQLPTGVVASAPVSGTFAFADDQPPSAVHTETWGSWAEYNVTGTFQFSIDDVDVSGLPELYVMVVDSNGTDPYREDWLFVRARTTKPPGLITAPPQMVPLGFFSLSGTSDMLNGHTLPSLDSDLSWISASLTWEYSLEGTPDPETGVVPLPTQAFAEITSIGKCRELIQFSDHLLDISQLAVTYTSPGEFDLVIRNETTPVFQTTISPTSISANPRLSLFDPVAQAPLPPSGAYGMRERILLIDASGIALQSALENQNVESLVAEMRIGSLLIQAVEFRGFYQQASTTRAVVRPGSGTADTVKIQDAGGGNVNLSFENSVASRNAFAISPSSVLVVTSDGDDDIRTEGNVTTGVVAQAGQGNDTIEGGLGDDELLGGAGNDTYIFADVGGGRDLIIEAGYQDEDWIDFENYSHSIVLDLADTSLQDVSSSLQITFSNATGLEHVRGTTRDDRIKGNLRDNHIFGLGGADVLVGDGGSDTLEGGDKNDVLIGDGFGFTVPEWKTFMADISGFALDKVLNVDVGSGPTSGSQDTLKGDGGDDLLIGGDGDDILDAGPGGSVIFGDSFSTSISIDLTSALSNNATNLTDMVNLSLNRPGDGFDVITCGSGSNLVFGGGGDDKITGGSGGFDLLFGNDGRDTIEGKDGSNLIVGGANPGADFEILTGGDGIDIILGDGLTLADGFSFPTAINLSKPKEIVELLTSLVSGFSPANSGRDKIDAGNGVNLVFAGGDDDVIVGGDDVDVLFGNDGRDEIDAKDGFNLIVGGANPTGTTEVLNGGADVDVIIGDSLALSKGDKVTTFDPAVAASPSDYLKNLAHLFNATKSNQQPTVEKAFFGLLLTDEGDDKIDAGNGLNLVFAGAGNDTVTGGDHGDVLFGNRGIDTLVGGTGVDMLVGGDGNDTIHGGSDQAANVLIGDTASVDLSFDLSPLLHGNLTSLKFPRMSIELSDAGNDKIFGGDGFDLIVGGKGRDVIDGGDGTNFAVGDDFSIGPIGDILDFMVDVFNPFKSATVNTVIDVGKKLYDFFTGALGEKEGYDDADTYTGGTGIDIVLGGDGDDTLNGGAGGDLLIGGYGDDTINAGPGGETVDLELFWGLIKIDKIGYGGPGDDVFYGGPDNDLLVSDEGIDTFYGGGGNDVLVGGPEADTFYGEDGDDLLIGQDGADTLDGGPGHDTIVGGEGDDQFLGGPDDDVFWMGLGTDALDAGAGSLVIRDERLEVAQLATYGNIATVEIRFNQDVNAGDLIDNGLVTEIVRIEGLPLVLDRYRYDASTTTLTLDVTEDGFGGGSSSLLSPGTHLLHITTEGLHHAEQSAVHLLDTDGLVNGVVVFPIVVTSSGNPPSIDTIHGPATGVRGQPRAFTATYTGIEPDDAPTRHWRVTDANGTVVDSSSGESLTFVPTHTGVYNVTFRITDDEGTDESTTNLSVTDLELQADLTAPGTSQLAIGGTTNGDVIVVARGLFPDDHWVWLNSILPQRIRVPEGITLSRVLVFGQDGDDLITVAESTAVSAWLYGDGGNDRLIGSAGNDVLLGGDGDDILLGHHGRDLLIGGWGSDRILGNGDDDLLIAGYTDFDNVETALHAILDEWSSTRDYAQRVDNILSGRLAGNAALTPDVTVHDDDAEDILTGCSGLDWFFANVALNIGDSARRKDRITGLRTNEFVSDLDWILGSGL